jgi:hypothetical protein
MARCISGPHVHFWVVVPYRRVHMVLLDLFHVDTCKIPLILVHTHTAMLRLVLPAIDVYS